MAKRRPTRAPRSLETDFPVISEPAALPVTGGPTRFIVTFRDDAIGKPQVMRSALRSTTGARSMALASDFAGSALNLEETGGADAILFEQLGIAVVTGDRTAHRNMAVAAASDSGNILAVEPEGFMTASAQLSKDYLRGFRDAAQRLYEMSDGGAPLAPFMPLPSDAPAEMEAEAATDFTWGINATRANTSRFSGQGIRVAVLDTGFDFDHPDFLGRSVLQQSFIRGQSAQDGNSHGTHCIGTACGPKSPATGPRYGVAHESTIFVGKVLNNAGSGPDTSVLAGMEWATTNRCQVISMSLGSQRPQMTAYNQAGQRALNAGCLVVAAAGNDSDRRIGRILPVACPANSGPIMAVAALDRQLQVAFFSNRSGTVAGAKVDISGPGVRVYSSTPEPAVPPRKPRYDFLDGTSMATPHVAGCAALWCQATGKTGAELYQKLTSNARATSVPSNDGGAGLVQAPQ
ncbi:MAG: S8 family serine peptidase [Pirellulaceae bacterium]|nr:S8 family serine peptidase [Pirellulaceae bacterium]